jgi:hypothetical protein
MFNLYKCSYIQNYLSLFPFKYITIICGTMNVLITYGGTPAEKFENLCYR